VRWARDDVGLIRERAKDYARLLLHDAADAASDDDAARLANFAIVSQHGARIEAMVALAASDPRLVCRAQDLDRHPWILNVTNGTLDLRTGRIKKHDPANLLTKLAPVAYDPEAKSQRWEAFLSRVIPDPDVRAFAQRAVGYSLTGITAEEKMFLPHGPTATGKSTFIEAVKATLGDYAATADFESFLRRPPTGGPRNDIATLAGRRLVLSIEVEEGRHLAEALVKTLTGGDTVTARRLYQESFEFVPAFKLWLVANAAPRVHDDDDAIWRRIVRIPFTVTIPEADRDPAVKATLRDPATSGAAILAWGVRGCLDWQAHGLGVPAAVRDATAIYRAEQDPLTDFLDECCVLAATGSVNVTALLTEYLAWCEANGERHPLGRTALKRRLESRGLTQEHLRAGRVWTGISLRPEGA
jgi:putative DNA primase/helicase